ncbi:MAG TPA: saccharopine dehydrogenase NADP-binding domain-containing protein [Solirubrobacteraceae bacterium]|jgi:short subunit dehydrogenase-like uncharacterized protein
MATERDLDLVVYGATGFVGKLTVEYLAAHAPDGVRIGLAGRSREKLERVKADVGVDWPIVTADSQDAEALKAMAELARVVVTTVGPYMKYGMPLVEACATAGTHYADLTGETLFMRETIDRFHAVAEKTGARIVHNCGFDSIPSDLGTFLLHGEAGELGDTTLVVRAMKGGPSGGTLDSMTGQIDAMRSDRSKAKVMMDPYALSPERSREPDGKDEADLRGPKHDDELGWLAPFVMAQINTRVVRRSNALQEWAYGRGFRYREVMGMGDGTGGRVKATGLSLGLGALVAGMTFPLSRKALGVVLPSPGEGPSEKARENGFFKIDIHTKTPSGERYVCHVNAKGDPGYKATALMLGEAGLCLALDEERMPRRAGVLTPATAMGIALVDRLRSAGMTLEVEKVAAKAAA